MSEQTVTKSVQDFAFTEAQIEAAARAVREVDARAALIADVDLAEYRARAALVAAAGAAPQAEGDDSPTPGNHPAVQQVRESDLFDENTKLMLKLARIDELPQLGIEADDGSTMFVIDAAEVAAALGLTAGQEGRRMNDAEALDKIAELHLGEGSYDDPSSALESISMIITATGRKVEGWDDE